MVILETDKMSTVLAGANEWMAIDTVISEGDEVGPM